MGTAVGSGMAVHIGPDDGSSLRDGFVTGHPEGTLFHLSSWHRAVHLAFEHEVLDLVARDRDAVVGVLPLVHVRSRWFGSRLISPAFGVYGGPVAATAEIAGDLISAAKRLAEERRVDYLELRCLAPVAEDLPARDLHVTFRGAIAPSGAAVLSSLPKETRRMVRTGLREGFVPVEGPELADDFYRLFSRGYRDLGTPVFPRRWIDVLLHEFGEKAFLFGLRDGAGGPVVAATLAYRFGDEISPFYVGAARECYARKVNNVLYFELMRRGRELGHTRFDFGRSKRGTGSYDFKRRWGLDEIPISTQFHLVTDREVPNLTPLNPAYARRIALWKKLPVPIANLLGPHLAVGLG